MSVLLAFAAWIVLAPAATAGGAAITAQPLPGLKAEVAAVLLSGRESGTLLAAVLAVPRPGGEAKTEVDLWVEIDGRRLLGDGEAPEGLRVEVHAYAMTKAATLAGSFSQTFVLPADELGDALAGGGVMFAGRLRLAPGEHDLRVLVRETRTQRFVLRVLPMSVPPSGDADPGPPPADADAAGAWIQVRATGDADAADAEPPDAAGAAWTATGRLAAEPERRRETLDLAAQRRAKKRAEAIVHAYRGALERLAEGAVGEALDDLAHLEQEALAAADEDGRGGLAAAQDEVVSRLAEADAESLVPVLYLHVESHDRYSAGHDALLAGHARERVIAVARRYGGAASSELAPSFAAAALAGMGTALLRSRLPVAGRRMMEEALALDARNAGALLELALDDERRGEYSRAAAYLHRLLAIRPRSDEGRLRLALSLRRGGQPHEAARWLRRVIDDGDEEWLLALAYQELARLMIAEERPARAVRLLEAGVRRLPRERRLAVLLAYAHDRSGEGRRGREVMAGALARADGAGPSPRLLYSRRPPSAAEDERPALFRQSTARLAVLAAALARTGDQR